jgi:hypothetical protein
MSPEAFVHYKTNIEEIDKQHLSILMISNEILRNKTSAIETLFEKIEELNKIFIYHLEYEEELMRQINFKYIVAHFDSHTRLKCEFNKIITSLKDKGSNKYLLIQRLHKILLEHVDHDDRQYIEPYSEHLQSLTIG